MAILTDQLDIANPTIGFVNQQLKLKGNDDFILEKFTNKYKMLQAAKSLGVHVPKTFLISNDSTSEYNFRYPCVVKPVDSDGSRGVRIVKNCEELNNALNSARVYSLNKECIVQDYIKGQEYVVDGFMYNNNYYSLAIGSVKNFRYKNTCISSQRIFCLLYTSPSPRD